MIGPVQACRFCGGTAGRLIESGHALCRVRSEHGRPTPTLGDPCPCCSGSGCHPRSAVGPVNPNQDAVDRWAPGCTTCFARGAVGMNQDDAGNWGARKPKYWNQSCQGTLHPWREVRRPKIIPDA